LNHAVELWDVEAGNRLAAFKTQRYIVSGVAFAANERTAIAVGGFGKFERWELPR
jgi:hypothetical protein